jgi:hypothetical protein
VLTISLKAQFSNSGFNHISILTGISFYSDNSDFENSLSDNGSHQVSNLGYGLGLSVPLYYPAEISAVTFDVYYDYRGNTNLQINSFMFCIGFDTRLIEREKYQLNFYGGFGSLFNYFQVNHNATMGNSSIDSSMLAQNPSVSFRQTFQTFAYFGLKNFYLVNDKISIFQYFDFRLQLAKYEYNYENGKNLSLPKYHINMFNFGVGLRYNFY